MFPSSAERWQRLKMPSITYEEKKKKELGIVEGSSYNTVKGSLSDE